VLATIACAVGLGGTAIALKLLKTFVPLSLAIDWRALLFTLSLAAIVVALTGLAPAWLGSRRAVGAGQRGSARAGGVAHSRLRRGLVGLQVALSLILLVVGALFGRSLQTMHESTPAVTGELLVADLDLDEAGLSEAERGPLLRAVTTRLEGDRRIRRVAVEGRRGLRYQRLEGGEVDHAARGRFVTPSWFDAVDVRPIAGRLPAPADESAVVVNRRFAENLLTPPGQSLVPLGAQSALGLIGQSLRLREADTNTQRVVQIVGIIENAARPPDPHDDEAVYLPMPVTPPAAVSMVVRTANPAGMLPEVRRALTTIAPQLPWTDLTTGDAAFARRAGPYRYLALSVGALSVLALALAAAGLYALLSYAVALRRHEIGVRMAIGAQPRDVMRLVLGQSVRVALAGAIVGLALVVPLTNIVEFLFVGVSPLDPVAMLLPLVVLVVTAVVAGALPARRAARIDPVAALRED
jgi:hypothetical protein